MVVLCVVLVSYMLEYPHCCHIHKVFLTIKGAHVFCVFLPHVRITCQQCVLLTVLCTLH